jgi:hypothetical protein
MATQWRSSVVVQTAPNTYVAPNAPPATPPLPPVVAGQLHFRLRIVAGKTTTHAMGNAPTDQDFVNAAQNLLDNATEPFQAAYVGRHEWGGGVWQPSANSALVKIRDQDNNANWRDMETDANGLGNGFSQKYFILFERQ